jgi:hypothetical protein
VDKVVVVGRAGGGAVIGTVDRLEIRMHWIANHNDLRIAAADLIGMN